MEPATTDTLAAFDQPASPYRIAYPMLGSRADAEDMVQEAYLRWHHSDAERVVTRRLGSPIITRPVHRPTESSKDRA